VGSPSIPQPCKQSNEVQLQNPALVTAELGNSVSMLTSTPNGQENRASRSAQRRCRDRSRSKAPARKTRERPCRVIDVTDEAEILSSTMRRCPENIRQHKSKPEKELPPASEQTWEMRMRKRNEGLDNFKNSSAYTMSQDVHPSQRPATPDPRDTSKSKRDWEKEMGQWRMDWRRIHNVKQLCQAGFEDWRAASALDEADDDLVRALEILTR